MISAAQIATQTWTTGEVDESGRPVSSPRAIQPDHYVVLPGPTGAHNWHPIADNKDTGLVYIPLNNFPFVFDDNGRARGMKAT